MKNRKNTPKETLCWSCQNSIPSKAKQSGCSWSNQFKPVENWKAIPNTIPIGNKGEFTDTYFVLNCPQFAMG